jgi:hypothetical protein
MATCAKVVLQRFSNPPRLPMYNKSIVGRVKRVLQLCIFHRAVRQVQSLE